MNQRVLMLAGDYEAAVATYHALSQEFDVVSVIREEKVPRLDLLRRRAKKIGWLTVVSQVLFMVLVVPVLRSLSEKRIKDIKNQYGLKTDSIRGSILTVVRSVNSDEAIAAIRRNDPKVVVISGTRILSERVLESTSAVFINMHAGITPSYRGAHGAYWALLNDEPENAGVTIHCVDKGIDTGGIISQARISISKEDNFLTYPWHQLAVGFPLLRQAVRDALTDKLRQLPAPPGPSRLWYHPTIFSYLWHRLTRGIK